VELDKFKFIKKAHRELFSLSQVQQFPPRLSFHPHGQPKQKSTKKIPRGFTVLM
jgi:hypothetical protein